MKSGASRVREKVKKEYGGRIKKERERRREGKVRKRD